MRFINTLTNFAADPANPYQVNIGALPHDAAGNMGEAKVIMTLVFSIIGALCLLFITLGGLRYVASQGDPQNAARAKGTIMYALIGLLVSVSAVVIVTFVIGRV